nr:MAG TPA: hypothetical protein [Caudoviricetes sp.]
MKYIILTNYSRNRIMIIRIYLEQNYFGIEI